MRCNRKKLVKKKEKKESIIKAKRCLTGGHPKADQCHEAGRARRFLPFRRHVGAVPSRAR